jgi:hypothetical protein
MKSLCLKTVIYFNREFKAGELQLNALRVLHTLLKVEGFQNLWLEEHKLTTKLFDSFSVEAVFLLKESLKDAKTDDNQDAWSCFVNACAGSSAFVVCFPDRVREFESIIPDLIFVIKEKTEVVRKNAAIFLAHLAKDEELNKVVRAHHGFDVLMSLKGVFGASN